MITTDTKASIVLVTQDSFKDLRSPWVKQDQSTELCSFDPQKLSL